MIEVLDPGSPLVDSTATELGLGASVIGRETVAYYVGPLFLPFLKKDDERRFGDPANSSDDALAQRPGFTFFTPEERAARKANRGISRVKLEPLVSEEEIAQLNDEELGRIKSIRSVIRSCYKMVNFDPNRIISKFFPLTIPSLTLKFLIDNNVVGEDDLKSETTGLYGAVISFVVTLDRFKGDLSDPKKTDELLDLIKRETDLHLARFHSEAESADG